MFHTIKMYVAVESN